jgi:hypothetical protein
MKTVADILTGANLSSQIRELLYLIPVHRRAELEYHGIYICDQSGREAVILKDSRHYIVCRFGLGINCLESPDIFAALEGVGMCQKLWREKDR